MLQKTFSEGNIQIRRFESADEEFSRVLYSTTRDDIYQLPFSDHEKNLLLQLQYKMQQENYQQVFPNSEIYIATYKNKPVGKQYIHHSPDRVHIVDIAILPEFQNKSIGTKLLTDILQDALHSKNLPVRLRVNPNNRAFNLYLRLGFVEIIDEDFTKLLEWTGLPPVPLCISNFDQQSCPVNRRN